MMTDQPDTQPMAVDEIAQRAALQTPGPDWTAHAPNLTGAQRRLFDHDKARLFRLLGKGDVRSCLALLADIAEQAPALADVLEQQPTKALTRPSITQALRINR